MKYYFFYALFVFIIPVSALAKAGMPQLEISSYSSQIFWLVISFFFLYFIMSNIVLPRIGEVLKHRRDKITSDLDKAEKDLAHSLRILPEQPHVLNYLAYSWIEKRINIEKGLEMLKRATELKKNDGYIIDSLGWANYVNKNYVEAEKFLQRAVELLPLDPIINDHYADTLWMLNKNIQARYFWKYVLNLEDTEQKLKDSINKKLIFGVVKKL